MRPVPAGTDRDVWVGTALQGEVTDAGIPSHPDRPMAFGRRPGSGPFRAESRRPRGSGMVSRIIRKELLRLLAEEQPQEVITGTVTFSPKLHTG